jgi:hypothetical protein
MNGERESRTKRITASFRASGGAQRRYFAAGKSSG